MDLRQYIAIGLRWWWLIILATIVGTGIGVLISLKQPLVYQATATIMIGQPTLDFPNGSDITTSQELAGSYAAMAQNQPVLQRVIDALGLNHTWRTLKYSVQAKPVPGTQLLDITVTTGSPDEAQAIANEIANQLILLSRTAAQTREQDENRLFVSERLGKLRAKIKTGQDRLEVLQKTLDTPLSVEQIQEIQNESDALESLVSRWEANYGQLLNYINNQKSTITLTLLEPAQAISLQQNQTQRYTFIGFGAGLAVGLSLIYLLENLDDTLKSADDLKQISGLTTLGAVGCIKGKDYFEKLVAFRDTFSPASEAYRMVRSNLQFVSVDRPVKSILVTSPTSGEGKSLTVANLAVVMAQAGLKTIVVDTNLRRPVLHQMFQVTNQEGLTDLLSSSKLEPGNYLRKSELENLQLLTSGRKPTNPSELLGSQRLRQLLSHLSEWADVVLLDSPPVLAVTDATVLANQVDGVILVIEAGQTRPDAVKQTISNLELADANFLGGILMDRK